MFGVVTVHVRNPVVVTVVGPPSKIDDESMGDRCVFASALQLVVTHPRALTRDHLKFPPI